MNGVIFIEKSALEVDFYFDNVKIASVIRANVIFHPESPKVVNNWEPDQMKQLADFMAPFIAKMIK